MQAVGSVVELSDVTESMKSMAHVPHDERLRIVAEREQHCEQIVTVLRMMKERIERKDELLQGYEKDLAKLRSEEDVVCVYVVLREAALAVDNAASEQRTTQNGRQY